MNQPEEILLVGTGNLASHLASVLSGPAGFRVDVAGRDSEKTAIFCKTFGGLPYREEDGKFYQAAILCVSDQAIENTAAHYTSKAEILIHTSGSVSIDILEKYSAHAAVFWPLQTFTSGLEIQWNNLPVCTESNSEKSKELIMKLCAGTEVMNCQYSSADRLRLHLAAVIVSNFVNHLYHIGDIWCRENFLDTGLLKPLITETARKIQQMTPAEAQTGPAKRNDKASIEKHLALLSDHPALKQVYNLFTEQIHNSYQYMKKP